MISSLADTELQSKFIIIILNVMPELAVPPSIVLSGDLF